MTSRRWCDTLAKGRSGRWPLWNIVPREGTGTMGDKGGKKDKDKSQKQKRSKHDKQEKKKFDNRQAEKPH
jgi:hypothetical protein